MDWTRRQQHLRERIEKATVPIWVCTGRSASSLGHGFSTLVADVFASTQGGLYIVDTPRRGGPLDHWLVFTPKIPSTSHGARGWWGRGPLVVEMTGTIDEACAAATPWITPFAPLIIKTCIIDSKEAFEKESQRDIPGMEKIVWPYLE